MLTVIKRNGKREAFSESKIINAVTTAGRAAGQDVPTGFCQKVFSLIASSYQNEVTIDQIQCLVESCLMKSEYENTAKAYIVYRDRRDKDRNKISRQAKALTEIIDVAVNDITRDNANINAATPAGMMMKFASETSKDYALDYLLSPEHAKAHIDGRIHCHDLDYYPTGSTTCTQIDLIAILEGGFNTNDGPVREPKSIRSASALAAIILQSSQNEQHGGQSFPNFEYGMAKYVRKSFVNNFIKIFKRKYDNTDLDIDTVCIDNESIKKLFPDAYNNAFDETKEETRQAMESFVHNLNSMHSRGGGQVVFSSINYGTDTTTEGRMVMHELLDCIDRGAGDGSTFIFPISVFKVKEGINYSERDWQLAIKDWNKAMSGVIKWEAPNFDLFLKACKVSARRLFPNFMYLDATFNKHEEWNAKDSKKWEKEPSTMG